MNGVSRCPFPAAHWRLKMNDRKIDAVALSMESKLQEAGTKKPFN